jgi:hypothetical protein
MISGLPIGCLIIPHPNYIKFKTDETDISLPTMSAVSCKNVERVEVFIRYGKNRP